MEQGSKCTSPAAYPTLQGARACGGRQSEAFLVWQLPQCGGRSHVGRTLAVNQSEQGSSQLLPAWPLGTNYRTITTYYSSLTVSGTIKKRSRTLPAFSQARIYCLWFISQF